MTNIAARAPSRGLPIAVLYGAGALIALAIVGAASARLSGLGVAAAPSARAVQSLALRFEDQDNGSVLVRNADDGAVIYTIAPETNGFMRATLRGLARARKLADVGDAPPFLLTRWDDGRMTLDDTTTGRNVALEAFGPTNAGAFAQLFLASGGSR
jgi:putative photosynthetic complex assembly protein